MDFEKLYEDFSYENKILMPRYTMVCIDTCRFCGEKGKMNHLYTLYREIPRGVWVFCNSEECGKRALLSQTAALIKNVAISPWSCIDVQLPNGYKVNNIRISLNKFPGKVIIEGVKNDENGSWAKHFLWDTLEEEYKNRIRETLGDYYTYKYPEELKKYFNVIFEC